MVKKVTKTHIKYETLAAVLSYVLLGIVWYILSPEMRKSSLVKHHVKQMVNYLVFAIVISIVASILNIIFGILLFLPIVGDILWFFNRVILFVIQIIFIIIWVFGIIFALKAKEEEEMPIIGKYAEKYLSF